ncbi:MAG TPA: hypothetical protein VFO89_12955, partial [Thermoanaerobaculia bacterium]|nr:hypothetical protein [Thermoanaerobaculia bacterium]
MAIEAHDVLAGPIVRRVEPGLVSVWIALRKPASVRLEVCRGLGPSGRTADRIAAKFIPPRSSTRGSHTLQVGRNLHIALAIVEPIAPTQLEWGQAFAYDLRIQETDEPEVGFAELGLLRDGAIVEPGGHSHPHLALGYIPGHLPSFVLPAAQSLGLRIAHGSCRLPTAAGKDTMPELDGLLQAHLGDSERLQMLFLTGDQIYADEPGVETGRILSRLAQELFGESVEHITVQLDRVNAPAGTDFPVDRMHFPIGRRTHLLNRAGFTSDNMSAHVMSIGETNRKIPKEIAQRAPYYDAWRFLPPEDRAIDVYLTQADRDAAWNDNKVPVWGPFMQTAAPELVATPPLGVGNPPGGEDADHAAKRRQLATFLTPSWFAGVKHHAVEIGDAEEAPIRADEVRDRLHAMRYFVEGLPRVRRALANVATYMMFDDHEVTDDWNLNIEKARSLRNNPLARNVARNALIAYTLFQGWGNDPREFAREDSNPNKVLKEIAGLFFDESVPRTIGPRQPATDALERLFDPERGPHPLGLQVRRIRLRGPRARHAHVAQLRRMMTQEPWRNLRAAIETAILSVLAFPF